MSLALTTFGSCRLEDEAGEVVRAPAMALILLAYLYDRGVAVARRDVANLLWPGGRETAATNLRSTLLRLADATGPLDAPILWTEGAMLAINRAALRCDLDLLDESAPLERLRRANNAVAMQFLPLEGAGAGPRDIWVRDVRMRMVGHLRAAFFDNLAAAAASLDGRSEIKRAGVLLLEADPHDHDVRRALTAGPQGASPSVAAAPRSAMEIMEPAPIALAPSPPRIALLPPEAVDGSERQGSIANALIEDLTIGLCASRAVSVVAPYTAERIQASKDKAAILQQHRVVYALDTKRSGDRLFAQLIFMPTDEIVWATRFELNPDTLGKQRADISAGIQRSIIDRIGAGAALRDDFIQTPEAYYSYLRGVQGLSKLTLPSIRRARKHFKEALDHENGFAAALAGVSRTLTMEWVLTAQGDRELLRQAETLAGLAVGRNDEFAGGFKELGVSQLYLGKIDDSLQALSKAEILSPHYADALWSHADSLVHASDPAAALDKITAAIQLNPLPPDTYFWTAAGASYFLRQYNQALGYIEQMRDNSPAARLAAACWGMLGDAAKARACRMRVLKNNPDFQLERWLQMIPHKESWQTELYREGLKKAGF